MISVVGPGTDSADAYHALSCPGQKYGVLKIIQHQILRLLIGQMNLLKTINNYTFHRLEKIILENYI